MKTNQPRAPSQFEVFWKQWWTHFQVNVTEAWSNHKVKLCHVAEIHCCRVWYIFYMIFVRVFYRWTSFCVQCCCLNTWNEVTLPYAPPRLEVFWIRWWLRFQENVTGAQSNHTSKCVVNLQSVVGSIYVLRNFIRRENYDNTRKYHASPVVKCNCICYCAS